MTITISESGIIAAVEKHIRIATCNRKYGDFTSVLRYSTNMAAANAILSMAEKEAGLNVRTGVSVKGLTKRLDSLIGGGSRI